MARKPRIHFTGAFYHVMLRGNGGQDLFYDEKDGQAFRALIADGLDRFDHKIHAYCFMPNHIHMLIEVGSIPLSKIMQNLSFRYTRYMNKKMQRVGHLFQGRYKALLVGGDSYLLTLVRYIHQNPVEAGLAKTAADWLWSSHRTYMDKDEGSFVQTDKLLSVISPRKAGRNEAYERFMNNDSKIIWPPEGMKGEIVGDEKFVTKVLKGQGEYEPEKVMAVPQSVLFDLAEQILGVKKVDLKSASRNRVLAHNRAVFAKAVHVSCGYTYSEIARGLKRDVSSLLRLVHKVPDRDEAVVAMSEAIRKSS